MPCTEDHNSQSQEAEARHTVFELPDGNTGSDIDDAAQATQQTGDQNANVAHLINIDTNRVSCLRMLTACSQSQTGLGLVQEHKRYSEADNCNQHKPAELKGTNTNDKEVFYMGIGDVRRNIITTGSCGIHSLNSHSCTGSCQHIHGSTGNGLVSFEIDCCHSQSQRENQAKQGCCQDGADNNNGSAHGNRHKLHDQCATQSANTHNAFQTDVDNTGSLSEAAAQCNQQQNRCEDQGILQQKDH